MKLYQVVIKDMVRRRTRASYATVSVAIGIMTVVGVLTMARAGEARIYTQLEKYGPNLVVMPATTSLDTRVGNLSLGRVTVGENHIPETLIPEIRRIADGEIRKALGIAEEVNIATLAPRLYVNSQIKGISVMVVGVEPEPESQIRTWWTVQQGDYLAEANQALLGSIASEWLGLKVGDKIMLNGHDVTVTGILGESGSDDDYQVFLPLRTLQNLFQKEGFVSSVDIRALCNACPVEVIADAVNKGIPGVRAIAVRQVAEAEMGLVERVRGFMLALAGLTLAVGLFAVVNTMMASIHERTRDIGIMRAVGASRTQIVTMFIYEALAVGLLGGALGYVLGTLLAYAIGPLIFKGIEMSFIPGYVPSALGLATLMAVLATLYPAFQATRIRVSDSFRSL